MDKEKKQLIVGILILFALCYVVMNRNYDPLARYNYDNKIVRETLRKNLNNREILYVVDYQIAPESFMNYIDADNFNIYHIDSYEMVRNNFIYLNDWQVVEIAEELLKHTEDFSDFIKEYQWLMYQELVEVIDSKFGE